MERRKSTSGVRKLRLKQQMERKTQQRKERDDEEGRIQGKGDGQRWGGGRRSEKLEMKRWLKWMEIQTRCKEKETDRTEKVKEREERWSSGGTEG